VPAWMVDRVEFIWRAWVRVMVMLSRRKIMSFGIDGDIVCMQLLGERMVEKGAVLEEGGGRVSVNYFWQPLICEISVGWF